MSKQKNTYSGAVLRMARDERMKAAADPAEQTRRALEGHERVIENARRSFVDMGRSLEAIRTERLYAEEFSTFAEYCEARWDLSEAYANRVINAARVAIEATPIGVEINSEAVARELVGLTDEPEMLRQIWDEATRRAAGGRVTAALVKEVRKALEAPAADALEGEVVDPLSRVPTAEKAVDEFLNNQTSGLADTSSVDESGEDHPATAEPGQAEVEGSSSAADVTTPSANQTGDGPSPEGPKPVDAPEQGGTGVARPAPAADLVNTPIGPMTRDFAEKLDRLVPDPNPHREWQSAFLNAVFAAAKAMRGYSGAEIAEKADDELRAEFARFVGDMESLLHEVSQAQLERAGAKVYKLRSVQ